MHAVPKDKLAAVKYREQQKKKLGVFQQVFEECLLNPDLVVCDEGHLLKNANSKLAEAVSKIECRRRIVLTGTPLQNHLSECTRFLMAVKFLSLW